MENKDLEEYIKRVGSLDGLEELRRNVYLKKMADGTFLGPPIGYPHIDRPWLKNYDEKTLLEMAPRMNLTEYLKNVTKNYQNLACNTYYGKKFSFEEFFSNVDDCSRIFTSLGVGKQDVIMYLVPNMPQSAELWLGAVQIGAISDFIDPRPDSMDVEANSKKTLELLKYEQVKFIVALDICYLTMLKPIEKEIKELGIEDIILVSASDYMSLNGQINYLMDVVNYNKLKNMRNHSNTSNLVAVLDKMKTMIKMSKEIEKAKKSSILKIHEYKELMRNVSEITFNKVSDPELISYIGHTSGTSGARPKAIPLTNKNSISTLEQLRKSRVTFDFGGSALHCLPFFASFGAYDNYLLNMISGCNSIMVPEFEINEFGYLLKKYKPNIIMGTPAWISALPDYNYLKGMDLSNIKTVIYGGDGMTKEDEAKVDKWLFDGGSKAKLEKGHGMSEFCGCGTYAQDGYNKPSSIGIPLTDTIYTIVNPNNEDYLEPLRFDFNQDRLSGELVVSSDAVTDGILYGDIIVPHYMMDGKSYIRTRDLVEMDKDGVFFHEARKDRSFTRFDGYKIKPYEIESVIEKNPKVKYARLTPYFDDSHRGIMPMCHLVLENDMSEEEAIAVVNDIVYNQIIASNDMSSRQIPAKFKIRESLPLTKNSKVDFRSLANEELDGSEINVLVSETNLAVSNIKIFKDNNGKRKIKKK